MNAKKQTPYGCGGGDLMENLKIRNIVRALWEQGPPLRFIRNFFITRNAWGMFSPWSHTNKTGKSKVMYNTKKSALKAAEKMGQKHGKHFSTYKCVFCDGYHIGKNRDNK